MCPRCGSDFLWIKTSAGLERIMLYLTGQRKYRCNDCLCAFRAIERRRFPRIEKDEPSFLTSATPNGPD